MLVLCTACTRHVKALPCPFCGGNESTAVRPEPPGMRRMSRAQLLTGAAILGATTLVAGCGGDDDPGPGTGSSSSTSGSAQPVYGAPVDAGDTDGGKLTEDGGLGSSGGVQPAYGAPADAGDLGGSTSGQTMYGAPVP